MRWLIDGEKFWRTLKGKEFIYRCFILESNVIFFFKKVRKEKRMSIELKEKVRR